jgi:hypothetical protein
MAWNDLPDDQMVSFSDIQGSNFKLKFNQSAINSNKCITKLEAVTMYEIREGHLWNYQDNQLIPKGVFQVSVQTFSYDAIAAINACSQSKYWNTEPQPPLPLLPPLNLGVGFDNLVNSIKVQLSNRILVGGGFTQYKGIDVEPLTRLRINGIIDSTFNVSPIRTSDNNRGIVRKIKLLSDGRIVVVGRFDKYGNTVTKGIMILNANGTLNQASTILQNYPTELLVDQNDNIIISDTDKVIKLNQDLTFNREWLTNQSLYSTAVELDEANNRIYIGVLNTSDLEGIRVIWDPGKVTITVEEYNYTTGAYIRASSNFNERIRNIKKLSDGRLIVVGEFTNYNNQTTKNIVVLNSNLTVNTLFPVGFASNWGYGTTNSTPKEIFIQNDGKILIGASTGAYTNNGVIPPFQSFNGVSSNSIVRLNTDFTRDSTFDMGTGFGLTQSIQPFSGRYPTVYAIETVYNTNTGAYDLLFGGFTQKYNGNIIGHIVSTTSNGTINSF